MRAILIDHSERVIDERRRKGIDKSDELWEGEWHLVNPPKRWHTDVGYRLLRALGPVADALGLSSSFETGIFRAEDDWRIPDLVFSRPESDIEAGVSSAELVVEIRSPGDDSYLKLSFYAAVGVAEVLILHEDRRVELFRRSDMEMVPVEPLDDVVTSDVLGVRFKTVDGPALRIAVGHHVTDI